LQAETLAGRGRSVSLYLASVAPPGLQGRPMPAPRPAMPAERSKPLPGEACRAAILSAATRQGIPPDLFLTIGLVESGRRDPETGTRSPWPWTINAEGQDLRFDTMETATAWVRQQQARGLSSMDIGCMQVNLKHYPTAFSTIDEAFDPVLNADYAARFLRSLFDGAAGGSWSQVTGFCHSQTPERAAWYRGLVETAMKGSPPAFPEKAVALGSPTGGALSIPNHADKAIIVPAVEGRVGRGLEAYRAMPVLLVRGGVVSR